MQLMRMVEPTSHKLLVDEQLVIRVSVGPIACVEDDVMSVYKICKELQN